MLTNLFWGVPQLLTTLGRTLPKDKEDADFPLRASPPILLGRKRPSYPPSRGPSWLRRKGIPPSRCDLPRRFAVATRVARSSNGPSPPRLTLPLLPKGVRIRRSALEALTRGFFFSTRRSSLRPAPLGSRWKDTSCCISLLWRRGELPVRALASRPLQLWLLSLPKGIRIQQAARSFLSRFRRIALTLSPRERFSLLLPVR